MMEKRNFVTSVRTPGGTSASDVDDIVDAGVAAFSGKRVKCASAKGDKYQKAASAKDEASDKEIR